MNPINPSSLIPIAIPPRHLILILRTTPTTTPTATSTAPGTRLRTTSAVRLPSTPITITMTMVPTLLPPRANSNRDPLHALALAHVHAIVDGEIAADQVRAHSGVLAGQQLRGAQRVGLVFAVVHPYGAGVAVDFGVVIVTIGGGGGGSDVRVGDVEGVGPVAAFAEACFFFCLMVVSLDSSLESRDGMRRERDGLAR